MSFTQAISYCLSHYATFQGRARRSEYWWFYLFAIIADIVASLVDQVSSFPILGVIVSFGLIVPACAAGARRLHDIDRSGWWQLIAFVPIVGVIWLIVLLARVGTPGPNRFGASAPA